ncbi:adhesion G-protein coupled receptor G2-like [Corythoichthys intestinalis]|uniref:adhesion G-protein coupled receptor G2-like n=1 Tax=Corythoichthys intestinalis TaxID=161448 RepID=UPI0025A5C376|nr:adhesion G-protein coupled receptor G2-like [Corythoichthys intestinalis]
MKFCFLAWSLPLLAFGQKMELEEPCRSPRGDSPFGGIEDSCKISEHKQDLSDAECCMTHVNSILDKGNNFDVQLISRLEKSLERTEVEKTVPLFLGHLIAVMFKPRVTFSDLHLSVSGREIGEGVTVNNSIVDVRLPAELHTSSNGTILLCMVTYPRSIWNVTSPELYRNRLLGLSMAGKNVTGLQKCVNITVHNVAVNESQSPRCAFLNFSTNAFSSSGCQTVWRRGQNHVTCSCDHLTYFGILIVSAQLSETDEAVMSYVTVIGCSLSLVALGVTLILFASKRKIREDVSMKVHVHLALALILLNAHFLGSQAAAAASNGVCLYVALALHYSLLATFSWMALESFHLYLLLVRVFNIYIRRYMLKLGLVGWSMPAAIVIVAFLVQPDAYGHVALDANNPRSTRICYLADGNLKTVSTLGVFSIVFAFNLIMLLFTIHRLIGFTHRKQFGPNERGRAKQNILTVLGLATLLGITWGLVFFSFGHLTTVGLYLFCFLNPLQGFFIFLWFVMSWRKLAPNTASSKTPSASG